MKENDNWGTPKWVADVVLNSVKRLYGGNTVTYDVSSRDGYAAPGMIAQRGVDFLDPTSFKVVPDRSGLRNGWFVNPPFSEIGKWTEIARLFPETLFMIAPYTPDTKWWLRDIEPNIGLLYGGVEVFSLGRVRFNPLNGQRESSPRFCSALLVFTSGLMVSREDMRASIIFGRASERQERQLRTQNRRLERRQQRSQPKQEQQEQQPQQPSQQPQANQEPSES